MTPTTIISALLALITVGSLAALDASGNSPVVDSASQVVALNSIENVDQMAQATYNMGGGDWPTVLFDTANDASSQGSTTAVGTTIVWSLGSTCYQADLPTPESQVSVTACPQQP